MSEPDALANEGWFSNRWRPACAWVFMTVVVYDYLLAPMVMQAIYALGKQVYVAWEPNTIKAGGMFFASFGGIIGITAWQRTQEKIAMYRADGPDSTVTEHTDHTSSVTTSAQNQES